MSFVAAADLKYCATFSFVPAPFCHASVW